MAKTLLNGVNDLLKKVQMIAGDSGELSTLTDSARQHWIDLAVMSWNEAVEQLYSLTHIPQPQELGENTIVLVSGDRDYALQTDLVQLHFPLIDETNGAYILEHPGGYLGLVNAQLYPNNYTGLPTYGAIRPTDGQLYLDRIPTSAEVGKTYKYRYDKDVSLSAAADAFPFTDAVYRALLPVAAELWKLQKENKSFEGLSVKSFARAARYLTTTQPRRTWTPEVYHGQSTDPFSDY